MVPRRVLTPAQRLASNRPSARLASRMPRARLAAGRHAPLSAPTRLTVPPPPRGGAFMAKHGKKVAAAVIAGSALYGLGNMSGRGVDKSVGRPTGMFRY